jgi:uncharacterized protein
MTDECYRLVLLFHKIPSIKMLMSAHTIARSEVFDLNTAIDHIAHWLPAQGPIKDFIHHNTLHAVQDYPFHEGVAIASKVFGANSYLPLADYQQQFKQGRITQAAIDWAIQQAGCPDLEQQKLRVSLFEADSRSHYPPPSLANQGIRHGWLKQLEIDLNAKVHPVVFRLLANFLDQGISRWTLPKEGESFWQCVVRLATNSLLPLYPFNQPIVRNMLSADEDQVIARCLQEIVGDESLYAQYLLEVLLAHPGWSGMVRVVENNPQALLARRDISLKQLLAVELACELAFVTKRKGNSFIKIAQLPNLHNIPLLDKATAKPDVPLKLRVWHEAMEWSLHTELLAALRQQAAPVQSTARRDVQALFCIDDRECSVRRYLEQLDDNIETFGAPGFFGIDFLYQGLEDVYPVAQCPVVIKPKHLIRETTHTAHAPKKQNDIKHLHFNEHSLLRGWLYTQTLGLAYSVRLAWSVFRPTVKLPDVQGLSEVEAHGHLHLVRETEQPTEDGYLLGFSWQEMADRVGNLLKNIGLTKNFAPLVVIIAHGSSSVNNPHFAAYDCGACAGKPGAPNARAFAWMANHVSVRELLVEQGIIIPDDTRFIAALHNTSRDEISYFDAEPDDGKLQQFQHIMHQALQHNAKERCRWFELAPKSNTLEKAHEHVISRASSIFEPRPELNHSNNLYCIVGRRSLSRDLFLDRRAFLQSYNPHSDTDGSILVKVLSAVIPVCGGINLEYLFSRIDNSVYGAGTKLPHNVIGLLGVANGVEGDLRTGLPSQMIEVHEPARLLMVVEQDTDIIDLAVEKLGALKEWLDNEWLRFVACHPETRELKLYHRAGWQMIELPKDYNIPVSSHSEHIIAGQTKTIPAHQLSRGKS